MTSVRSVCCGHRVGELPLLLTTALHFAVPEMTSEGQSLGQKIRARARLTSPYPSILPSRPVPPELGSAVRSALPRTEKNRSICPGQYTRPQVSDSRPVEFVSKAAEESRIEDVPV